MISRAKEPDCDEVSQEKVSLKPIQSPYWKVVSAEELEKELLEIAIRDSLKRRARLKRPNT
jgi:hypothetical protein